MSEAGDDVAEGLRRRCQIVDGCRRAGHELFQRVETRWLRVVELDPFGVAAEALVAARLFDLCAELFGREMAAAHADDPHRRPIARHEVAQRRQDLAMRQVARASEDDTASPPSPPP